MIEGIFVEGLIFSIMVLGILISYRILDFADLTCDGSVATGAAVATMCIVGGLGITAGLVLAFLAGVLCGLVTASIHNKLRIPGLLAGILTMTMLYSVNLRILGNKANVSLVRVDTLYRLFPEAFSFLPQAFASLLGTLIFVLAVKVIMDLFFRTDLGLALGALGGNEQVILSQGMNPATLKLIGVGLSNGLIALSGALLAQYQGFADANLGQGIRILRQDLWEMIVSFLISQQNNIPRIRRCISNICERYGERRQGSGGRVYYTFPGPAALAAAGEEELRDCNLGYRSRYVKKTAQMILEGQVSLEEVQRMDYLQAREELQKLYGVGAKVADCICLFALHQMEAFPVDTHIRQALEKHYPQGFPFARYKDCSGVMQQYIFYRELLQ